MPRKQCKRCSRFAMRRINRQGMLQHLVFPRMGIFPWECVFCREREFFRDSGVTPESRITEPEHRPNTAAAPGAVPAKV